MIRERLLNIIVSPHVSEKSTILADTQKQFVFKVLPNANKIEIKQAVEAIFNVDVEEVRTTKIKGKVKRRGQIIGKRKLVKKAYVKINKDQDINFASLG